MRIDQNQIGCNSRRRLRFIALLTLSLTIPVGTGHRSFAADDDEGSRFFRERIEPVLVVQCYECHSGGAKQLEGGLRLDSSGGMLRGGDSGPAVVKSDSKSSLLIQAIRHENGLAMPPKKERLSDQVIVDFVKWIDSGLPDPRPDIGTIDAKTQLTKARQHWAFQPLKSVAPTTSATPASDSAVIDAFIRQSLDERHWQANAAASPVDLIRRVTFDLTGLPPSPEEIDAFLNDSGSDAYEKVVDRLLSSRQYGERWAQHWLDVVRFAESEGYEYDRHIPDAWRFRDYVIDSLNSDKPFDRFVMEQIAGDEIEPDNPVCQTASIFHRLGPVRRNAGNPEIALSRNEVLTERTDIIGAAFLGLTVGCARCHDHKLEPISQKDYYSLQAYLAATTEHNIVLATADEQQDWDQRTKRAKDEIEALRATLKKAEPAEKAKLEDQIELLEDQLPGPLPTIPSTRNDHEKRTPIHVLRRGVWENKGQLTGARPPSVLVADDLAELPADEANPRAHLSRWLVSPSHPLTARVIVNRIWQQHFGTGLVKTANDFGVKGERPSHPELLDWLATKLVEQSWRLKPLHRMIVLSQTYRQSSDSPNAARYETDDPENRLLWRFSRRRMSGEEVRDAMLAAAGRLNLKAGGPSVFVPVDPELVQLLYKPSQWTVTKDVTEHDRRSIYLVAKRNLRSPFLENFDAPALQTSCSRRESSTHAPQALEMLNGTLSNDLARAFAERLTRECQGDRDKLVDRAFRLALGRLPTPDEKSKSLAFLENQPVTEFALAIFNLNGFLYVR